MSIGAASSDASIVCVLVEEAVASAALVVGIAAGVDVPGVGDDEASGLVDVVAVVEAEIPGVGSLKSKTCSQVDVLRVNEVCRVATSISSNEHWMSRILQR